MPANLRDRTPHALRVEPRGDPAHVRQVGHRRQAATAEVEPVELHFVRRVGEREGRDQGPQQGRLARLRAADHQHVARGGGEVLVEDLPLLLEGLVDQAERDRQAARCGVLRGVEPALCGDGEGGQQFVQRRRPVQRRQPHLVRGDALPLQSLHDHVQHSVGQGVVLLPRLRGACPVRIRCRVHHRHGGRGEQRGPPLDGRAAETGFRACRAVHAGDVRRLEAHHLLRAELQVTRAGHGRKVVGVRHTEGRARLGGRERPQTDAVGQVGVQSAQSALLQPLRGEQQVHAQRTADASDLDEHVDEVGLGSEEFAELVDHEHERGERLQRSTGGACLLVVMDVGVVARGAQKLLAPLELAADRVAHAVDERQVVGEVGDHGGDMRHAGHARERRAALEVRKDEVQRLGGVRDRQAQHQRAQQFGLAGTGRPHTQTMRTHAVLRGLLQVQHHRAAVLADADRHPQALRRRPRPPGPRDVHRRRVPQPEQFGEVQVGEQRFVVVAAAQPQRSELPRERLGCGQRQPVGLALVGDPGPGVEEQPLRTHDH